MSEVTLHWDQRVLGRNVGDVETVELTEFMQAILDQGRAHIVMVTQDTPEQAEAPAPILGVVKAEPADVPEVPAGEDPEAE